MALVNPNIAMSFRQPDIQAPNALAQFAQIQQIQGGQQAQELNALKMQEAQAAMQERNALRQLNPAAEDYENQLFRVNPTLGIQYRKERTAAEASGAATAASRAAASTSEFELKAKQRKFLTDLKRDLSSNPSDANITAFGEDAVLQGLYTPEQAQATVQQLLAIPAADRQQIFAQSGASAAELRPQVVAPGASLVQGNKAVYTAPFAPEKPPAPPAAVAEYTFAKTPDGGNFKGSFQDFITARAAAGRAPAQPVAPTITQIVDPSNPNQMITVDARRYQGGGVGSPGVLGVGGKEPGAAVRENKAEAGKTQLADDLDNLRASFTTLDKMRAIPSTERNALSNIAAATAATGIGQVAGRFVGTEAQVEREIINSARTRLVNSIKNATGMSAQQLNSNVELQTMLKSISDPGQPVQAALRIIDDIDNAYVKGAGMPKKGGGNKPPAPGASNIVVTPDGQSLTFPNAAAAAQFKKAAGL